VNHADVELRLADYLEGDLPLDDRALVDAHLDQCEPCSREVAEMQQTISLLRMLPEPEIPPMIAGNVMRRIRAGEGRPGLFARVGRGIAAVFEPSFVLPASAAAVAALVMVVLQDPTLATLAGVFDEKSGENASIGGVASSRVAEPMSAKEGRGILPNGTITGQRNAVAVSPVGAIDGPSFRAGVLAAAPRPTVVPGGHLIQAGRGAATASRAQPLAVVAPVGPNLARSTVERARASSRGRFESFATSSGGGDPRDGWLAFGLEDPLGFVTFLNNKSLAEQELWVTRLADRADSRGLLGELTSSIEGLDDESASVLAEDFRAAGMTFRGEVENSR
jgi:hypothetical protein